MRLEHRPTSMRLASSRIYKIGHAIRPALGRIRAAEMGFTKRLRPYAQPSSLSPHYLQQPSPEGYTRIKVCKLRCPIPILPLDLLSVNVHNETVGHSARNFSVFWTTKFQGMERFSNSRYGTISLSLTAGMLKYIR